MDSRPGVLSFFSFSSRSNGRKLRTDWGRGCAKSRRSLSVPLLCALRPAPSAPCPVPRAPSEKYKLDSVMDRVNEGKSRAEVGDLSIIGVASPYAWDVVESANRRSLTVSTVDNFGGASAHLPGLESVSASTNRVRSFTLGLSSAPHRGIALLSCSDLGFTSPVSLIDPTAVLASTTQLGHCVYVNAGVVVGSNTTLGCAANINRSASIGHDNVVGFSVSIGPGATLAGGVTLADFVTVGAGAVILPGISLGRGSVIGAGAVVTANVASGNTVVGNPARALSTQPPPAPDITCPYCTRP